MFLVHYTETVLFINYDKPQVPKCDILTQQSVCAYDNVDFPFFEIFEDLFLS